MRVSQLIEILEADIEANGDRDVYYLSGSSAYTINFLGAASSDFGEYFWMTADSKLPRDLKGYEDDFKAPPYRAILTLVK